MFDNLSVDPRGGFRREAVAFGRRVQNVGTGFIVLLLYCCVGCAQRTPAPVNAPLRAAPVVRKAPPVVDYRSEDELIAEVKRDCDKGEREQAKSLLETSLAQRPNLDELRLNGSVELWHTGMRREAVAFIDARPASSRPYSEFARLSTIMHLELADDGPNISHTRDMVSAKASDDPEADKAWVAEHLNRADLSSALFLRLAPEDAAAIELRARYLDVQRHWSDILTLLASHPTQLAATPRLQRYEVDALLETGAFDEARARARAWLERRRDDVALLESLARAAKSAGDEKEAALATEQRTFYAFLVPGGDLAYALEYARWAQTLASHFEARSDAKAVRATVNQLARKGDTAAAELLAAFVWHHSHDELETLAMQSLDSMGAKANAVLLRVVADPQSVCTVKSAAEVLAKHQAPGTLPILVKLLPHDQRFGFPMNIPHSLAVLGDTQAVPSLVRFLLTQPPKDLDSMTVIGRTYAREQAALALGVLGGEESQSALERAAELEEVAKAARGGLCILRLRSLAPDQALAENLPPECNQFRTGLTEDDLDEIGTGGQAIKALEVRPTKATRAWLLQLRGLKKTHAKN